MKTEEFKNKLEEMGFCIADNAGMLSVYSKYNLKNRVFLVDSITRFRADTFSGEFESLDNGTKEKLFNLIINYVCTPVEEREKERMYYLRHKWLCSNGCNYLYKGKYEYSLVEELYEDTYCEPLEPTKFTEKEIESLKKFFNTKLEDFEMVEVQV